MLEDQLRQGHPHGKLVVAGPDHVARDGEDLGPRARLGADGAEPLGTPGDNVGHAREGLHVVDHRGHPVQARHRREGRLQPGLAPAPLQRGEESRLLAADVQRRRPGGRRSPDRSRSPRMFRPTYPASRAWANARWSTRYPFQELAPQVDEGLDRLDRISGQDDALDQLVGMVLDQEPVLEGAGLTFVRVADQVPGTPVVGEEAPLLPGGEPGPAPAPEARVGHHLHHVAGRQLPQGLLQGLVAPLGPVHLQVRQVQLPDAPGEDRFKGHRHHPPPRLGPPPLGWPPGGPPGAGPPSRGSCGWRTPGSPALPAPRRRRPGTRGSPPRSRARRVWSHPAAIPSLCRRCWARASAPTSTQGRF